MGKLQPVGVTVTVGRAIVLEVSWRRSNVVVAPAKGLSIIEATRVGHVSQNVTLKV